MKRSTDPKEKKMERLPLLLEKIDWILSKPVIGYGDRSRLKAMAARINRALDPEDTGKLAADAIALINKMAECGPLAEARV